MSAIAVARKDFLDVRRAKVVWFVAGLYAFFAVLMMYFGRDTPVDAEARVEHAFVDLMGIGAMLIPLVALVAAYLAIAGERESGRIKYLLAIPNSRRDVVLGKYLSRAGVVAGAIVGSFALSAVLAAVWYPSFALDTFVGAAGLTLLYALVYVAIAVGISAATDSRSRAMGGAIGFFFVTNVLTMFGQFSIGGALDYLLNDVLGAGVSGDALMLVQALISPTWSYMLSMELVMPAELTQTGQDLPWFLQGEPMVAVLLAWLVVPLALGTWWFGRVDLG